MKRNKSQILKIVIIAVIFTYALIRIISTLKHLDPFIDTLREVVAHRKLTPSEKMLLKYPRYYDYITWIKVVTPGDAIIYQTDLEIPYGEPLWPSNNIQMNSAWLYPRRVVPWKGIDTVIKEDGRPTYMMVIDGFPRSDVIAKNVILFDLETKQIVGNYIHDNYPSTKLGLIEL